MIYQVDIRKKKNLHRIQSQEKEARAGERSKEPLRLNILILCRPLRMETAMVQGNQIPETSEGKPNPANGRVFSKRAQIACCQRDPRPGNGGQQVGAGEAGYEGEVYEEQGRCQGPGDETEVEDLAEDIVVGVGDVFVFLEDVGEFEVYALAGGEGEVGNEGDGCD